MKRSRIAILLVFMLMMPSFILAAPNYNNLGTLKTGTLVVTRDGTSIPTYKAYDTHYVATSDLIRLGLTITYNPKVKTTYIKSSNAAVSTTHATLSLNNKAFKVSKEAVYLGNFKTTTLKANEHNLIPLNSLGSIGHLNIRGNVCDFVPSDGLSIVANSTTLKNFYNEAIALTVTDIYFKDKAYTYTHHYNLLPNQVIKRQPIIHEKGATYIATIVTKAEGKTIHYYNNSLLGQVNASLLKTFLKPPAPKKPAKSPTTSMYGDPITLQKVEWIEASINKMNISSPTQYLVWTVIPEQRTYIFKGSNHKWSLYKNFICSTGRNSTPTPLGKFALTYKVPSFGQNKGYCCKHAFGFIGTTYLYHSIIFDKTGTYLLENKGVLGRKASQGCIRFSPDNAKWFYDHMISGTTVYIS